MRVNFEAGIISSTRILLHYILAFSILTARICCLHFVAQIRLFSSFSFPSLFGLVLWFWFERKREEILELYFHFSLFYFTELKAVVLGTADLYVKTGSDINLTCKISKGPHELGTVFWYKGIWMQYKCEFKTKSNTYMPAMDFSGDRWDHWHIECVKICILLSPIYSSVFSNHSQAMKS